MTEVTATTIPETQEAIAEKVVHLRDAVQEKAGAVSDWAQDKAQAVASAVKEKPLATAGISAGAAFAFGVVVGLLLTRAMPAPPPPSWRDRLMELRPHW